MDDILFLLDANWKDCHLKEYLQISGYRITEMNINDVEECDKNIVHKDLILIVCENAINYFDKCAELRSFTEIPIMVVSKTNDEWAKIKMFRSGADDYMTEPFQEMALIARMQARIKQFKRLTRYFGYIKTRDMIIEALNRKVFINDNEVDLTIKEFDVLLYLAQRPNSAVTREELYNAVWRSKVSDGNVETVTTYVMKLRQKIEEDPDNPKYIETVWGVGYRFVL